MGRAQVDAAAPASAVVDLPLSLRRPDSVLFASQKSIADRATIPA